MQRIKNPVFTFLKEPTYLETQMHSLANLIYAVLFLQRFFGFDLILINYYKCEMEIRNLNSGCKKPILFKRMNKFTFFNNLIPHYREYFITSTLVVELLFHFENPKIKYFGLCYINKQVWNN